MTISVIIPGYNNPERWWRRCVESILSSGADEIVCIDDGSADKPRFLEDYPSVRVVYLEKNVGLAAARNAALEYVTGDYVTFLDSDDEVEPDTFRQCKRRLDATQSDVAVYGVKVIWPEDGLMKVDIPSRAIEGRPLLPDDIRDLSESCLLNYSCNKVYRKKFLDAHNLRFDKKGMPCEDIIFNLNVILAGARFCTVDSPGYVYYRTRGTLLSRYKNTSDAGMRLASETWRKYKVAVVDARKALGDMGEVSEAQLQNAAWRNAWMPGTPYSLLQRWRMRPGKAFFKMMIFMLLRRHFYFRPIRRWNTRRNYPHVVDWHGRWP